MPEISRFFGIVVRMHYDEHERPHFHVWHGGTQASVDIATLAIVGEFPARAAGLVVEWASLHRGELSDNWDRVAARQPPKRIAPLR